MAQYKKGKKITAIAIYQENLVKWQHIMKEGTVRACESSEWLGLLCIVNIYIKIKHNLTESQIGDMMLSDIPVNILH